MTVSPAPRILVADDDPDVLEALRLLLKGEGCEVETATSPGGVLVSVEARDFDACLIDMNYTRDTTGGIEGLDLLSRLQQLDGTLPVLVMTAWGSVGGAVEAMRRGARDYIEKPWDNARLLHLLRTQLELGRAIRRGQRLESENRTLRREGFPDLVAESPAMGPVLRLMERVGPSDANALITGEHGTGKEVVARWLHAASARAPRPIVIVNLGGLADGVFESELFGHVKGAFTDAKVDRVGRFELADGGTLFLDEVVHLSVSAQVKLLRALETGEVQPLGAGRKRCVDFRVVSAAQEDTWQRLDRGLFRHDLYHRLAGIVIELPLLAERPEDIVLLAEYFAALRGQRLEEGAAKVLEAHGWPGNVRELRLAIERAGCLVVNGTLPPGAVRDAMALGMPPDRWNDRRTADCRHTPTLQRRSWDELMQLCHEHGGDAKLVAASLGIRRSALYARLKAAGISLRRIRKSGRPPEFHRNSGAAPENGGRQSS
jgi:DNA-binding NtrC family response regulator